MGTKGNNFRRLILIILLEEFILPLVHSQTSPLTAVHSKTHSDSTDVHENASKTPLLIFEKMDPIEERFDLMPKQSSKSRSLTMTPRTDDKAIDDVNTSVTLPLKPLTAVMVTPSPDSQRQMAKLSNIFTGIGDDSWSLEEKIITVEQKVCGDGCGRLMPFRFSPIVASRCHKCHCDPTCIVYHTCCPDLVLRKQVTYDGLGSDCVELIATGIDESDIINLNLQSKTFSSMITRCHAITNGSLPANNRNAQNPTQEDISRSKCEQPDFSKPDEHFPVSDHTTKITYRNVHCAKCNDAEEEALTIWESEVVCDGNLDLLLETKPNKTELYRMLTSKEEVERTGCHIAYSPTQYGFERKCRYRLRPVIESCNETGLWPQRYYNADIERACHMQSYSSIFMNKYKNMFCFLCNTNYVYDSNAFAELLKDPPTAHTARVSFSTLIDFADVGNEGDIENYSHTPTCHEDQFYDNLTCSCRDIKCSAGKEFVTEKNVCQSFIRSNLLGYRACARFDIQVYGATKVDDFDRYFRELNRFTPSFEWKVTVSRWCPGSRDFTIHVDIWEMQSDSFAPLEELERGLEDIAIRLCETVNNETWFGQMEKCTVKYVEECPDFRGYSLPCGTDDSVRVRQTVNSKMISTNQRKLFEKTTFIPYLVTNRCAFVEISVAESNASEAMLTHFASRQRIFLSKIDYLENDTKIGLCLDEYLHWSQENSSGCGKDQEGDDSFDTWTTAGIISITCSCISLLFLFLTFVTYMLFEQLRSGGGKNIMVLTVTLFVAQALYEFAIEQYENEYLCSVFGISIHFFWLASVFSMNACTLERFCKLCFPLKSRSFFMSRKSFIIATAYTFSCPLLIVVCNISANLSMRKNVGYGNPRICYINERYSRIFSFVVPMCAIVVLNTALLIFTICKLRRKALPGDGKTSQTRIGFVACVRLSVVTGATWLVSLLYEAVPVQAIGYVFTALLALQGVVFFFSIVVNKKVLEMYIKLFSCTAKPHSSTGSGTKSTALLKKNEVRRNDEFHAAVTQGNKSKSLSADHTDLSRLCSGNSGVDFCEVKEIKEQVL